MPRTRQGGPRAGAPATAYGNRTDLNENKSLPARAATDQTYGKAQQQLQAQRTVPMAPPPALPVSQVPLGGPSAPPQAPRRPPPSPPTMPPGPAPGELGALERPTERPGEPVTSGSPIGPGPNILPGVNTQGAMANMLARAAQATGSAALHQLAATAAQNGL